MTERTRRRPSSRKMEQIQHKVRGFAAELLLHNELAGLRLEIERLDNRCEFIAHVHGRRSQKYRDAAMTRDSLLLRADQIITQWAEKHVSITRVNA